MGIGYSEIIIILIIIVVIFGVGKLPEIGKGLGKGIRDFKESFKEEKEEPLKPKSENNASHPDN